MVPRKVVVLIADIGGYTNFIRLHKTSLAHADLIVHELLDSVVQASRGRFELSKLEGDAVFLYANEEQAPEDLGPVFAGMHRAFHVTQQAIDKNQTCGCAACVGVERLKLKIVAHRGEALVRKIRKANELTGECVIAVHRMLKNEVPIKEYALLSEELARAAKPEWQDKLVTSKLSMEGFEDDFPTAYLDLRDLAGEAPPSIKHSWLMRSIANVGHWFQALPFRLGLKQPLKNFRNVAD